MAWRTLRRYISDLENRGELIRISRPVEVELEAGCIADRLVKTGGKAVIFEQPLLPNGEISKIPLAMNLFGTRQRTNRALQVTGPTEIGERLVALMKPDIGTFVKRPWKALPLLKSALSLPPKRVRRPKCQQVVDEKYYDVTTLPIPKTWPLDGGRFITLPLVVTKDAESGEYNLGMYRGQVFGPRKIGLHWQIHKHGAAHADTHQQSQSDGQGIDVKLQSGSREEESKSSQSAENSKSSNGNESQMPVAICIGGPPELIFSAISPLPDNLEEYMFAGFLAKRRLRIAKAVSQDLYVPAEADIVIEGYVDLGETQEEGPFGDHFGFYSLTGEYPVMHVTAITHRKDAILPATIVGQPPMEDGYLGEAIGSQFTPVLQFQHRDVAGLHLPLETGFHNLAIVASKQRYPRQGRKTALGLLGAGQMMFLKTIVAVDADQDPSDLEAFLDCINDKVCPSEDLVIIPGMVADTLETASPFENIHSKLLIDATSIHAADARSDQKGPLGSPKKTAPAWRLGKSLPPSVSEEFVSDVRQLPDVEDARLLRGSMLVVTTHIENSPSARLGQAQVDEVSAAAQRTKISQLENTIFQLDTSGNLRWLFITNDDLDLHADGARRRLLWQLFSRFDVGRDLHFDETGERVAWDATTPIPSLEGNVPSRRWPAVTLHDPEILARVEENAMADRLGASPWPNNLMM